jgi:hypothetical protein
MNLKNKLNICIHLFMEHFLFSIFEDFYNFRREYST